KVPTMIDGDLVVWESHTIVRYLAALHAPALHGATPAEKTMVERWMDCNLGALKTPYVAVFKDAKNAPEARAPDFAEQVKTLNEQLKILDGQLAKREWLQPRTPTPPPDFPPPHLQRLPLLPTLPRAA